MRHHLSLLMQCIVFTASLSSTPGFSVLFANEPPQSDKIEENLIKNGGFEVPDFDFGVFSIDEGGKEVYWKIRPAKNAKKCTVVLVDETWQGVSKLSDGPEVKYNDSDDQTVKIGEFAVLYQAFPTIPDHSYQLTLFYAPNPGIKGATTEGTIRILGDGVLLSEVLINEEQATNKKDIRFKKYVGTFIADSQKATLEIEVGEIVHGFIVDDVRVVDVSDEK